MGTRAMWKLARCDAFDPTCLFQEDHKTMKKAAEGKSEGALFVERC